MQELVEASGSYERHWEVVEDIGKRWKTLGSGGRHWEAVEDMWETGKGLEGVREVRKAVGKCGRDGKAPEGNTTLQIVKNHFSVQILFAGIMLITERFIIEVLWERGMVSMMLSFSGDGFLGCCNDNIEIKVQLLLRLAILGI